MAQRAEKFDTDTLKSAGRRTFNNGRRLYRSLDIDEQALRPDAEGYRIAARLLGTGRQIAMTHYRSAGVSGSEPSPLLPWDLSSPLGVTRSASAIIFYFKRQEQTYIYPITWIVNRRSEDVSDDGILSFDSVTYKILFRNKTIYAIPTECFGAGPSASFYDELDHEQTSATGLYQTRGRKLLEDAEDDEHNASIPDNGALQDEARLKSDFLAVAAAAHGTQLRVLTASAKVVMSAHAPQAIANAEADVTEDFRLHFDNLKMLIEQSPTLHELFKEHDLARLAAVDVDPVAAQIAVEVTDKWDDRKTMHPNESWIKNPSTFVAHVYKNWLDAGTLKQVHLKHDPVLYRRYAKHISSRPQDDLNLAKSSAGRPPQPPRP